MRGSDREKLLNLVLQAKDECMDMPCTGCPFNGSSHCAEVYTTEYLLNNGVALDDDNAVVSEKQKCEIEELKLMHVDAQEKIRRLKEEVERYRAVIKTLEFVFGRKLYD